MGAISESKPSLWMFVWLLMCIFPSIFSIMSFFRSQDSAGPPRLGQQHVFFVQGRFQWLRRFPVLVNMSRWVPRDQFVIGGECTGPELLGCPVLGAHVLLHFSYVRDASIDLTFCGCGLTSGGISVPLPCTGHTGPMRVILVTGKHRIIV